MSSAVRIVESKEQIPASRPFSSRGTTIAAGSAREPVIDGGRPRVRCGRDAGARANEITCRKADPEGSGSLVARLDHAERIELRIGDIRSTRASTVESLGRGRARTRRSGRRRGRLCCLAGDDRAHLIG